MKWIISINMGILLFAKSNTPQVSCVNDPLHIILLAFDLLNPTKAGIETGFGWVPPDTGLQIT